MAPSTFACPSCQRPLQTSTPLPAGTNVQCPQCKGVFTVGASPTPTAGQPPAHGPAHAAAATEPAFGGPGPVGPRPVRPHGPAGKSNKGLIIGLSVGGGVVLLLGLVLLLVLVLGSSPQQLILGRWQPVDLNGRPGEGPQVIEFRSDGTVLSSGGGREHLARYRFLSDDTLEIEEPTGRVETLGVTVTRTELTFHHLLKGETIRLRRLN
jgi:hypothetical protein